VSVSSTAASTSSAARVGRRPRSFSITRIAFSRHDDGVCHHRTRTPESKAPRGIVFRSAKPMGVAMRACKWM
jgi:hypothetical protein